jgi:hypothetical protein
VGASLTGVAAESGTDPILPVGSSGAAYTGVVAESGAGEPIGGAPPSSPVRADSSAGYGDELSDTTTGSVADRGAYGSGTEAGLGASEPAGFDAAESVGGTGTGLAGEHPDGAQGAVPTSSRTADLAAGIIRDRPDEDGPSRGAV